MNGDDRTFWWRIIGKYNWLELPVRNAPFEPWKLDIVKLLMHQWGALLRSTDG